MAAPNKCPSCGEYVSMFAAGCAVCGAELDPGRGRHRSPIQRLRVALGRVRGERADGRRAS